jgi:hypothetical protein
MGRQRVIAFVFFGLFALVMIGGGAFIIRVQQRGTPAEATVTECHRRARSYACTGTWVAGGDLTEGGRVVTGTIEGADRGDVGRTLDVRLSGGRAYTRSLRLPLILIGVGVAIAGLAAWQFRTSAPKPPALDGPPPTGPALAGAPPPGASRLTPSPPLRPPPPGASPPVRPPPPPGPPSV